MPESDAAAELQRNPRLASSVCNLSHLSLW